VTLRTYPAETEGEAHFNLNNVEVRQPIAAGATEVTFGSIVLDAGEGRAEPWLQFGSKRVGVRYLDVRKLT
jgi:hypothetical protein